MKAPVIIHSDSKPKITNNNRPQFLPSILDNNKESKELSTALRRRRDRYARQAHHIIQQQELLNNSNGIYNGLFGNTNGAYNSTNGNVTSSNTNYTNGSYINTNSYQIIKDNNDHYYNGNGVNGHEDDAYINRTVKNLNLADVLINGLFIRERIFAISPTIFIPVAPAFCLAVFSFVLFPLQLFHFFKLS